jgi:OPA family glycerol-3-phosphate transporter-like MFS transporter 3
MATVVGIIDGTGSLGAAFGQLLVAGLSTKLGWNATFYMFIVAFVCSGLCLVPLFIKEWKDMRVSFKLFRSSMYQPIHVQTH